MSKYTYYLKDSDGLIAAKIELTKNADEYCLDGRCYKAISWSMEKDDFGCVLDWHFVADVYCKWDSCTHWYFHGEDYDTNTNPSDHDSYYHLCGSHSFNNHIRIMCFIWKAAELWMCERTPENRSESGVDYTRKQYQENKELVDFMLDGYTIEKIEE